jgi:serpin B
MKNKILAFAGLVILTQLGLMSCGSGKNKTRQENDLLKNTPIEMRNNKFAFDLFNAISPSHNENLVVSPFSISTALAMTYAGAGGNTATQMARTLYFDADQESFHVNFSHWMNTIMEKGEAKKQLQIANSLWPQEDYPFKDEFMDLIREYYGSAFYKVNYKGDREKIRQQINAWVEKHTNDLIKDLIQPGVLVDDTRLVLVNAIYFLSNWKIAFDENATHTTTFNINRERTVSVPFMYMKDDLMYVETDDFKALELEYEGSGFSMLIVLPAGNKDIDEFVSGFDASTFAQTIEKLEKQEVQVYLPSFKVRSKFDLEKLLASMGMPDAFSNRADFSNMTPLNDLKIDKVIHEAFIDVHEEGTEAAASTAVVIIRKSAMVDPPANIFRADRPFFYAIRENASNSILFMGKVVNPADKAN